MNSNDQFKEWLTTNWPNVTEDDAFDWGDCAIIWNAAIEAQKVKGLAAVVEALSGKLKCGHNPSNIPTCSICQLLQRITAAE